VILLGLWFGACGSAKGSGVDAGTDDRPADTTAAYDASDAIVDARHADAPYDPADTVDAGEAAEAGTSPDPEPEAFDVAGIVPDSTLAATIAFVEPTSPCANPVTMRVTTAGPVARVVYDADGWSLGTAADGADGFALTYSFQQTGERLLHAVGQSADGAALAEAWRTVVVQPGAPGVPDVPYFYQYANDLYPGSTCQNTSVAMLLAWYGWGGEPDDITALWGKAYAQDPVGLAEVFNSYAAQMGIPQRLLAHTDGTVADVRALLAQGRPVIVHGYFTAYGHVLVTLAYDGSAYIVNDPAGRWSEQFQGGYPFADDPNVGHAIAYEASPFEAAIATSDGQSFLPVWYHEILASAEPEGP